MRITGSLVFSVLALCCLSCSSTPATSNTADVASDDVPDTTTSSDSIDTSESSDTTGLPDVATATCDGVSCPASSKCTIVSGAAKCVCDAGLTLVGTACIASTFVEDQCRLSCLELDSCSKLNGQTVDACRSACVAGASDGEAFAKAVCVGLNWEHDTLWCGVISACDTMAKGDTCATRCAAKDKCGFLAAPGITSGSSLGECEVLCRAYDTIDGNLKTTDTYATCLDNAAKTCDPFDLALCEAYNGATLCGNICGWLGTEKYCNYIPGRWADEAACTKECSSWSPKQANAVFGCYNRLNFSGCSKDKALACFNPPTDLPAGVTTLSAAVAGVCPDAMASDNADVNAWHFLGRTELWPSWMQNFSSAVACVKAMTSCPSQYDFDWLAPCFLTIAPDVAAACNAAQQCNYQNPNKVPYLTADGTTNMDVTRCEVAWQNWKTTAPDAFASVATCLSKADTSNCDIVNGCIINGDPEAAACSGLITCWDTAGANPYSLPDMTPAVCTGLFNITADPKAWACVNKATDCDAKNACLPVKTLAPSAIAACSLLVPCWDAASINPFPGLGKLTVSTCAAATTLYDAKTPGVADMVYGCLQNATGCSARLACLPAQ